MCPEHIAANAPEQEYLSRYFLGHTSAADAAWGRGGANAKQMLLGLDTQHSITRPKVHVASKKQKVTEREGERDTCTTAVAQGLIFTVWRWDPPHPPACAPPKGAADSRDFFSFFDYTGHRQVLL